MQINEMDGIHSPHIATTIDEIDGRRDRAVPSDHGCTELGQWVKAVGVGPSRGHAKGIYTAHDGVGMGKASKNQDKVVVDVSYGFGHGAWIGLAGGDRPDGRNQSPMGTNPPPCQSTPLLDRPERDAHRRKTGATDRRDRMVNKCEGGDTTVQV